MAQKARFLTVVQQKCRDVNAAMERRDMQQAPTIAVAFRHGRFRSPTCFVVSKFVHFQFMNFEMNELQLPRLLFKLLF